MLSEGEPMGLAAHVGMRRLPAWAPDVIALSHRTRCPPLWAQPSWPPWLRLTQNAFLRTFRTSFAFACIYFSTLFFFSFGAWINTKCKTVQTAFRCKTKRVMCHASYALSSHWIRLEATVNVNFKWKYITFAEKPTGFFWTAQKPGWRASRWKRQAVGGWKRGPAFALKETLGGGEGRALSAQLSLEDCCQDISFVFHYLYFLII